MMPRKALETIKHLKHWSGLCHPLGCRLVERPPGRRVLVLAAHPDDEAIGCGGTLRKHVLAGERVVGVYLTDGAGTCGGSYLGEGDKRTLIESQARKAGTLLGLQRQVFCRQRILRPPDSLEQVTTVWQEEEPDVVYLPFFMDPHVDHMEVNRLLLGLLEVIEGVKRVTCVGYEIWSLLFPNRSVNISTTLEAKQRAISAYGVATDVVDYVHASTGLAAYRALLNLSGRGYAEAFFVASALEYAALARSVLGDGRKRPS
ncbi:MAG: PIG-L deacetylase family protein [Candidatus Binatia bacterium]